MIVGVTMTVFNEDGSRAMHAALEENVPLISHDPNANGARALMRLRELVPDGLERIEAQARAFGVTDDPV